MDIRLKAKRVHESYTRAGGAAMIPVFYDKLINASSEIKEKFDQVATCNPMTRFDGYFIKLEEEA